jgi:tetratricopeptide (TPR) repeat protein
MASKHLLPTTLVVWAVLALARVSGENANQSAPYIINQIIQADYAGDRTALKRLYEKLRPIGDDKQLVSRLRYWRGFAMWRRAMNGFNDSTDTKELKEDLKQAVEEFDESWTADPAFVDPKVGDVSCLSMLAFAFSEKDQDLVQKYAARARTLLREASSAAPDNPRLLWVMGANLWYVPEERGGGQAKAVDAYLRGLESLRKRKTNGQNALEPIWGEPELLMSLAWANLNRTAPDIEAAEQYAKSALQLVPNWHYVRDILLPQISKAKVRT